MLSIIITEKDGKPLVREFDVPEITLGRVQGNDIVLPKSNISKYHARIVHSDDTWVLVDTQSTNGTYVQGKRITAPHTLQTEDKIFIGDFTLEVRLSPHISEPAHDLRGPQPSLPASGDHHQAQTRELNLRSTPSPQSLSSASLKAKQAQDSDWNGHDGGDDEAWGSDWDHEAAEEEDLVLDTHDLPHVTSGEHSGPRPDRIFEPQPLRAHEASQGVGVDNPDASPFAPPTPWIPGASIESAGGSAGEPAGEPAVFPAAGVKHTRGSLALGPLGPLLEDSSITQIYVNHAQKIFVERHGSVVPRSELFPSPHAVMAALETLLAPLGRPWETTPLLEVSLPTGLHIRAILPPWSIQGPSLSIEKSRPDPLQIDDLVAGGCLNADMAAFLERCVEARHTTVIVGGPRSGKTTLLNVLASFIRDTERTITLEDTCELKLEHPNVVSLETHPTRSPAGSPASGPAHAISRSALFLHALGMRPDRLVVAECKGDETLHVMEAMGAGYDGLLTCVQAMGLHAAVARLEALACMHPSKPAEAVVRRQIAKGVRILVEQVRYPDGSRRIVRISKMQGLEADAFVFEDVFKFEPQGLDSQGRMQGYFKAMGMAPQTLKHRHALDLEIT